MQKEVLPSLFTKTGSDKPIIFDFDTIPRRPLPPVLTFKFKRGVIGLSKGLLFLLTAEDSKRVSFVNYKGNGYVTRVDKGGHWLALQTRPKTGICSAVATSKALVRQIMREMGHGPDEVIAFPVAPYPVAAAELQLDPKVFKYPLYRIVTDQKAVKDQKTVNP